MEMGCLSLSAASSIPNPAVLRRNSSDSRKLLLPGSSNLAIRNKGCNLSVRALNRSSSISSQWDVTNYAAPLWLPRFEDLDTTNMLLRQRIIFLGGPVDDITADFIITQLLLLDSEDETKDITLFINSPGGSLTGAMGIYDAMKMCKADVSTVNMGLAAYMGAFLLAAGSKGKRFCMPNARVIIGQPIGQSGNSDVDTLLRIRELSYSTIKMNKILSRVTGKTEAQIEADTEFDYYMSSWEAKDYGLVDAVVDDGKPGLVAPTVDTSAPPEFKLWFLWKDEGIPKKDPPSEDKFLQQSRDVGAEEKEEAPTT